MAKGHKDTASIHASCADYDETAGEELTSTRKVANVGAKRSSDTLVRGGGGGADTGSGGQQADVASDSGYSSHTQATSASADSTPSITATAEHVIALQDLVNKQRLVPDDGETHSQRSGSTTSAKPKKRVACKEPNCEKCVAARKKAAEAVAGKKPKPKVAVNTNVSPVKSRERSPVKQSPSKALARQKPEVHQQAAQPQPRRRDSQQAGPRPTSMYEMSPHPVMGPPPGAYYNRQAYPHSGNPEAALMLVERQGAMVSARGARGGGRGAPAYNPQAGSIPSARKVPNPTVVQVQDTRAVKMNRQLADAQRAQQPKQKAQPRTQVIEAPTSEDEDDDEYYSEDEDQYDEEESEDSELEEHEDELAAAARMRAYKKQQQQKNPSMEMQLHQQLAAAQAREAQLLQQQQAIALANQRRQQMDELARRQQVEEMARRQQVEEMARRGQMPPPLLPPSALPAGLQQMPTQSPQASSNGFSMRKTQQPQITYGERRPSELERLDSEFRASLRSMTPGPSGSSANRRPSLASSGATKATSYSHPGHPQTSAELRNNRRMSYMGGESRDHVAGMHNGFQQAQNDDYLEQIITEIVRSQVAGLSMTPTEGVRFNVPMDDKLKNAMQYQSNVENVGHATRRDTLTDLPTIPLTQSALRRNAGIPSLSGSSRSKRSSDEDPSLISAGHRLTTGSEAGGVTVNGDEMKVRIDTANGFEMEFEGRRVVLQPVGDGTTAELIIGGKPRGETTYISTRGSTATRSVINRQPSQRQRRETRNDVYELEDSDDRTERRTVYARDDARREREERRREDERREKQEQEDREREREARRLQKERKALQRERDELKEQRRRQGEQRRRHLRYDNAFEDDDEDLTSESHTSEEESRRTQRPVRRQRAKTYEEKRERRRAPASPERRSRDDGTHRYPPSYA